MRTNSATHLYALSAKQASWGSFGWEAAKWIPGVGAVPSFIDAGSELLRGNYGNAALHAASGAAGLMGGGAIAKGLTSAGKLALRAGAGAATRGAVGRAASTALNAGGNALTQAGAGAAKAVASATAANTAAAQGIQKVIPVAQQATWTANPARSAVNYAVKNPFDTARMFAAPPSAGPAAAAVPAPVPPPQMPATGIPAQQFRPRPMVNF